ncbi:cytochrome b/b6 domain-containing protein [Bradyrhizobium sp. Pear76]|uniref:cytochrome b/b6 domain-containing protein n=1 Tax=Bradyrhizobium oropedii TaxID=1571201 RepID=UPI001E4C1793|nr:cytochrome b/b6 domain-containing protein [Bradyrhizobium oropedii]MCC8965357.1 cytochrome b/b6 domain-containing protein [Bradyrhizobium oropedii]
MESALADTTDLRVWDLPVRAMHWLLVIGIGVCWWTGLHNELEYHLYSGCAVLWIVLMRLYWGVVGSSTARFVNFVRGPKAILDYASTLHRRDTPRSHGHNALGAISIVFMMGLVLAVVILGLFAVDVDGLYSGPLSSYVTFKQGRDLAHLHYHWFNILLWVIALHLTAVIFHFIYKRQNLIGPMIHGKRPVDAGDIGETAETEIGGARPLWRFVIGAVLATAIVYAVSIGFYF